MAARRTTYEVHRLVDLKEAWKRYGLRPDDVERLGLTRVHDTRQRWALDAVEIERALGLRPTPAPETH